MKDALFKLSGSKSRENRREDILFGVTFLDNICSIIKSIQPPCTLGIFGEWGKGKTTLFNFLREDLKDEYETVYFSAWRFQRTMNLVPAMIEDIKSQIDMKNTWDSIVVKVLRVLEKLPVKFGVPGIELNGAKINELRKFIEERYENIQKLKDEVGKAVSKSLGKSKKKALLILIDDLDRCLPETALEFLENIKNFLWVEGTIFIIALDEEVIETALRARYGQQTKVDSINYLGKIIDLSLKMPQYKKDKLTEFLVQSLPDSVSLDKSGFRGIISQLTASNPFIMTKLVANPRKMEHIIKKFALINWMNYGKDKTSHELAAEFILLIIKEHFYPLYRTILVTDAQIIIDLAIYDKGNKIGNTEYGDRPRSIDKIRELYGEEMAQLYHNKELHGLVATLIDMVLTVSAQEEKYLEFLQNSVQKLEII